MGGKEGHETYRGGEADVTITDLLILALATWRATSLLNNEDGPGDLLAKWRHWIGVRYDEHSVAYGTNVVSKAVCCIFCLSIWIGLFWAVLYLVWPLSIYLALPLALSAGAIVIEECAIKR